MEVQSTIQAHALSFRGNAFVYISAVSKTCPFRENFFGSISAVSKTCAFRETLFGYISAVSKTCPLTLINRLSSGPSSFFCTDTKHTHAAIPRRWLHVATRVASRRRGYSRRASMLEESQTSRMPISSRQESIKMNIICLDALLHLGSCEQ